MRVVGDFMTINASLYDVE